MELALQLLFTALSTAARHPAINRSDLAKYIEAAGPFVAAGAAGARELHEFAEQVKALAEAGVGPTAAQWADWRRRGDEAHARIQAAAAAEDRA